MCTVVHDVYIVLYPTIYTVCLCVSVYSAIFILRAPSLQAKFLIVCMLVYTVIKLANVWSKLLHRVQTFTTKKGLKMFFSHFCHVLFSVCLSVTKFLFVYIYMVFRAFRQSALPVFIQTNYTLLRTLKTKTFLKLYMVNFIFSNTNNDKVYFILKGYTNRDSAIIANKSKSMQLKWCAAKENLLLCLYLRHTKTWPWLWN